MNRRWLVLPALALLLIPVDAFGGYPRPADSTIRIPNVIGGVRLGMLRETALDAFGGRPTKCYRSACVYGSGSDRRGRATVEFTYHDPLKVNRVSLVADLQGISGTPTFAGPLLEIRTKGGIGLGTPIRRVIRKFPGAPVRRPDGRYVVRIRGKRGIMEFVGDYEGKHRIYAINLEQRAGG